MTKIIKYLLILGLLVPAYAGAQSRDLKIDTRAEVKTEVKGNVEVRSATAKERVKENQENRMKMRLEVVIRHFRGAIERLDNILTRLESRIEKFRSRGADVSESAKFAAEARTHLGQARISLDAFVNASSSATSTLRVLHAEVKTHLRATHEALVKSLRALKASVRVNATTTVQ